MNGFEVIKVVFSDAVVAVSFDSASWKSETLGVTILAKKRMRKIIDFVVTIRTIFRVPRLHTNSGKSHMSFNAIINGYAKTLAPMLSFGEKGGGRLLIVAF